MAQKIPSMWIHKNYYQSTKIIYYEQPEHLCPVQSVSCINIYNAHLFLLNTSYMYKHI